MTCILSAAPISGAPYKSAKDGGGDALSSVSAFNHRRAPMSSFSDLMPSKQINGQTIMYKRTPAASKLSPDGTQHS